MGNFMTILSTCKPFNEDEDTQEFPLRSWSKIKNAEKIIVGDGNGIAEICQKYAFRHFPDIKTGNAKGLRTNAPLLNAMIDIALQYAKTDVICLINSDIVTKSNFCQILVDLFHKYNFNCFISGNKTCVKTWDSTVENIDTYIDNIKGQLFTDHAADYFVFHKSFWKHIVCPPFVIGRGGWDNWFLYTALKYANFPIVATSKIKVLHKNHGYNLARTECGLSPGNNFQHDKIPSFKHNIKLMGNNIGHLGDPRWIRI